MTPPAPFVIPRVEAPAPQLLIEVDLEGSPRFLVLAATAEDEERMHVWLDQARYRICDEVVQTLREGA